MRIDPGLLSTVTLKKFGAAIVFVAVWLGTSLSTTILELMCFDERADMVSETPRFILRAWDFREKIDQKWVRKIKRTFFGFCSIHG